MTELAQASDSRRTRAACAGAAVWGFAEATLFFLVPDVLLTWLAVARLRPAIRACLFAVAGALAGGLLMYGWGAADPPAALAALDRIPAISSGLIDAVGDAIERQGVTSLFLGPLSGTPYKLFAVQAGATGRSLPMFLLVSIPARGLRFLGLTLLSAGIATAIGDRLSLRGKRRLAIALWATFYLWYFTVMPN